MRKLLVAALFMVLAAPVFAQDAKTPEPEVFVTEHTGEFNGTRVRYTATRSEEHTSELQSHHDLVCRLLLEKKKQT